MLPDTIPHVIVGILFMTIVAVAGWFIWFYNKMANNKIKVENSRVEINVLFIHRINLMIKLAKTVTISCSGSYGQECLQRLMATNYSFMNLEERTAGSIMGMDSFLEGLFNIIRRYPDIKANEDFLEFQNQLRELDKKQALSLQRFNAHVQIYNKFLTVFPNNIAALILGVKELIDEKKG